MEPACAIRFAVVAGVASLLCGCAELDSVLDGPGEAAASVRESGRDVGAEDRETATAAARQDIPPTPPEPPLRPKTLPEHVRFDAKSLVGKTRAEATDLFGEPAAVRERAPGVIWTYGQDGCALSLFFYMDVRSKNFRVLTYEMTSEAETEQSCYGVLRNGRS